MIANEKSIWPYIISRLIAIVIIIVPLLIGLFATIVDVIFNSKGLQENEYVSIYLGWGYTLLYFTWSFFLLVLLPYSWIYVNKQLKEKNIIIKFLLFFALLTLMGLLLPNASIIDLYPAKQYIKIMLLYYLLTITICPLCNLTLNRVMFNQKT